MRTTVTLDPDTAALLRKEVARRHLSFKQVIKEAIRRGLAGPGRRTRNSVEVLAFRSAYQPGVDRRRLQQMADRDADRAQRRS